MWSSSQRRLFMDPQEETNACHTAHQLLLYIYNICFAKCRWTGAWITFKRCKHKRKMNVAFVINDICFNVFAANSEAVTGQQWNIPQHIWWQSSEGGEKSTALLTVFNFVHLSQQAHAHWNYGIPFHISVDHHDDQEVLSHRTVAYIAPDCSFRSVRDSKR